MKLVKVIEHLNKSKQRLENTVANQRKEILRLQSIIEDSKRPSLDVVLDKYHVKQLENTRLSTLLHSEQNQLIELNRSNQETLTNLSNISSKNTALTTLLRSAQRKVKCMEKENLQLQKKLTGARSKNTRLITAIRLDIDDIKQCRELIPQLKEINQLRDDEITSLKKENVKLNRQLAAGRRGNKDLTTRLQLQTEQFAQYQQQLIPLQNEIHQLQEDKIVKTTSLKREKAKLKRQLAAARRRNKEVTTSLQMQKQQVDQHRERLTSLQNECRQVEEGKNDEITSLQRENAKLNKQLTAVENEEDDVSEQIDKCADEILELQNRINEFGAQAEEDNKLLDGVRKKCKQLLNTSNRSELLKTLSTLLADIGDAGGAGGSRRAERGASTAASSSCDEDERCAAATCLQPRSNYAQCDGCDRWFHPRCVGLKPYMIRDEDEFTCPACCLAAPATPATRRRRLLDKEAGTSATELPSSEDFTLPNLMSEAITFPCTKRGKPLIPGWDKLRRTVPHTPGSSFGVLCGLRSNITVVNCDVLKGDNMKKFVCGVRSWQMWLQQYGDPNAPTVETPSGGLHVYFRFSERIQSEIRAIHGLAVGRKHAGKIIKISILSTDTSVTGVGSPGYEYVDSKQHTLPVPEVPQWLINIIDSKGCLSPQGLATGSGFDGPLLKRMKTISYDDESVDYEEWLDSHICEDPDTRFLSAADIINEMGNSEAAVSPMARKTFNYVLSEWAKKRKYTFKYRHVHKVKSGKRAETKCVILNAALKRKN